VLGQLQSEIPNYRYMATDIRDREAVLALMEKLKPDLIMHTAAQPSHDRAAAIPFLNCEVSALRTLYLLEAAPCFCPESPFIHMSTNKVYGDRPKSLAYSVGSLCKHGTAMQAAQGLCGQCTGIRDS